MLRTVLYRRVIAIAMGAAALVALGLGLFGTAYFRDSLDTSRERAFLELQGRIDFMDRMVDIPVAAMVSRSEKALLGLAREGWAEGPSRWKPGLDLAAKAASLGVDGIYLIDGNDLIVASSEAGEVGLDLSSIGSGLKDFIATTRGKGRFFSQGLSVSEKTGQARTYGYYSLPGSSYVIEVSCDLDPAFAASFGGISWREFVELCFSPYLDGSSQGPVTGFDILNLGGGAVWSLIEPGRRVKLDAALQKKLEATGQASVAQGQETRSYRVLRRWGTGEVYQDSTVAEVVVDFSPVTRFGLLTALFAIGSCAAAGLFSLLASRSFFDRSFLSRVEAIRSSMSRVASGERESSFDPGAEEEDELTVIGKGIEAMLAEVRASEERLRNAKAAEAVGLMAGGLAHDLSNLLAGTKGAAALLRQRLDEGGLIPPDELTSTLTLIERTGERGSILVRDLLALARADRPAPGRVDLVSIAEETVKLLKASNHPAVEIEFLPPEGPAVVMGSREDLARVLLNLCNNGIQAMTDMRSAEEKRGGRLEIGLMAIERPGSHAWDLSVRDSGVGMNPETVSKLFTPFFTTKPRRGGSGMGLAASRAIVELHGGQILVDSGPGTGSTFHVILPKA